MRHPTSPDDPTDPRRVAVEILRRVDTAGSFVSPLLESRERGIREPRDRAFLHELVLGSLRNRSMLDDVLSRVSRRPLDAIQPDLRRILHIAIYEILFLDRVPGYASVDRAVDSARLLAGRSATAFANGVLRTVARRGTGLIPEPAGPGDTSALSIRSSHPLWWVERAVSRLGWEAATRILTANNSAAPVVLRVREGEGVITDFMEELRAEGVTTEPGRFNPRAVRVVEGRATVTRAFRRGAWVQDEASQLVPSLVGESPGSQSLDACAAPGGKTCCLADASPRRGCVIAMDRHAGRLVRLRQNVERLGFPRVFPVIGDLNRPSVSAGAFDSVLVDAPCSGSGTFRRRPELRWRLRQTDLPRLVERQSLMLDRAATLVRSGGVLVYSVCSIEPEEGEGVVRGFLARHADFRLDDPSAWLPDAARPFTGPDGIVRTVQEPESLDGFQAARFVRR